MPNIIQHTCKGPNKERNGDFLGNITREEEGTLLVVCDGVSQSQYGADAAYHTVEILLEQANETKDWTKYGIAGSWASEAHFTVEKKFKNRGLCTLVLVLITKNKLYGVYAGDSSCMIIKGSNYKILTIPHIDSLPRIQNGKPVLDRYGSPVIDKGVTRAIGQKGALSFDTFQCGLESGIRIACFTDGIREYKLQNFLENKDIKKADLENFVNQEAKENDDDSTLILYSHT